MRLFLDDDIRLANVNADPFPFLFPAFFPDLSMPIPADDADDGDESDADPDADAPSSGVVG